MKKYNEILKESADLILIESINYTKVMFKGVNPEKRKEVKKDEKLKVWRNRLATSIKTIRKPIESKKHEKVVAAYMTKPALKHSKAIIKDKKV